MVEGNELPERKLDRRRLLELGAVGAASLIGGSVVAACGGGGGSAAPTAATTETPASTASSTEAAATTQTGAPATGGTVRIATETNSTDGLDPAKFIGTAFDSYVAGCVYSTLIRASTSYEISGDLAADWSATPDAKTWTFRLLDGVTFHDGRPLTSADVAYTLKRILDPDLASAGAALIGEYVTPSGISTPDPTTIALTLDKPNAFLPVSLAWINFGIVPDGTTDFTTAVGTGPFSVTNFEVGASAQFERNPDYFKDGKPYLESVELVGAPDDVTRVQSLLAGEADIVINLPFSAIDQVDQSDVAGVQRIEGGAWATFAARSSLDPFTNAKVAEAFKYALDREKFSTVAYFGQATPSADVPIPVDDIYYPAGLEPRPYDPERAKSLLAEAGHGDGLEVVLYTRNAQNFLENAQALKSLVAPVGINVTLNNWPVDTYWDKVWLKKPFVTDFWGRAHASYILPVAYSSKGTQNETAFSDPTFDKLIAEAPQTTDEARQKELYGEAINILNEKSGSITPVHVPRLVGTKKTLTGLVPDWGTWTYLDEASFTQ